jgi:hypothetical protein
MKNGLHKDEISLHWRIFKKDQSLKEYWENKIVVDFTHDMEVWEGWDEEVETLNLTEKV